MISALLLTAATSPAITSLLIPVFVTNFPSNQQVTVTNFPQPTTPSIQTGSVDLELINVVIPTAVSGGFAEGVTLYSAGGLNLTTNFSFKPNRAFQSVSSAKLSIIYGASSGGTILDARVNIGAYHSSPAAPSTFGSGIHAQSTTITLSPQDLRAGSNSLNVGGNNFLYIYQIRLTVEYTYLV